MIQRVEIITETTQRLDFSYTNNKVTFNSELKNESFTLKFTFKEPIISVRNHDFKWCLPYDNFCASVFAPKLVKLKNGYIVQANSTKGSWHIDMSSNHILYWSFNQENQHPITQYRDVSNKRDVVSITETINLNQLALLISNGKGIEFSRSRIPFSGVICFTDHCDFDTLLSLKTLRTFFRDLRIKTTKGFFLNHHSKRKGNASYENDKEELESWADDGHELAYHSLTQSLRNPEVAFEEFKKFSPVLSSCTWIDHGYQPYNLSLSNYKSGEFLDKITTLNKKGITNYWTYIDSGFATTGVINQLNPDHFTLAAFQHGIKANSIKARLGLGVKNLVFHYWGTEKQIDNYRLLVSSFKQGLKTKSIKEGFKFTQQLLVMTEAVFRVSFKWKKVSRTVYPLAKFTPTIFKVGSSGFMFQTLEMTDFVNGLSLSNIDTLIKESGLSILHTYFTVQLNYHEGRLLQDEQTINPLVLHNFQYLSEQIIKQKVWNPTLEELVDYLQDFFNIELDINTDGDIYEVSKSNLISRTV